MNYYFLFCQDTLLLTRDNQVPTGEECPIELASWQHLHHLPNLNEHGCYTARLDSPIVGEEWNMVPLATDRTLQHGWQGARNSLLGSEHKILWRLWRSDATSHRYI